MPAIIRTTCSILVAVLLALPGAAQATPAERDWYPAAGAYLGAAVSSQRDDSVPACRDPDQATARAAFEGPACVASDVYLDRQYHLWDTSRRGEPWPTPYDRWSRDAGNRLFFSWLPYRANGTGVTWKGIAGGLHDKAIDAQARRIKGFGSRVYLAFHPEPEDDVVGGHLGTAADFRAAWRRIVTRFRALGVTNVRWVLVLMAWTFDPKSRRTPATYYPGAGYVDAVGIDGFNFYDCAGVRRPQWQSFAQIFDAPYRWSRSIGEPMVVAEMGTVEHPDDPLAKATWILDAAEWIKARPQIEAVSYFHVHHQRPDGQLDCEWQVDTSIPSLLAFRAVAADPYFTPPAVPA